MGDAFSRRAIIAEAHANLKATPVRSLSIGALTLLLTLAVGFGVLAETQSIAEEERNRIEIGGETLVATTDSRDGLSAQRCDSLEEISAVEASGGVVRSEYVAIDLLPSRRVDVLYATPGFVGAVWPHGAATTGTPSVFVGEELADDLGLRVGDHVKILPDGTEPVVLPVGGVLGATNRLGLPGQLIVIETPAQGFVPQCVVSLSPGNGGELDSVVLALLRTPGAETFLGPVVAGRAGDVLPEERLASRLTRFLPLAGGAACAVLITAFWFARRHDIALYRLLGMRSGGTLLMIAAEHLWVVIVPACVGALAVASACVASDASVVAIQSTALALLAMTGLSLLAVPMSWGVCSYERPSQVIKGI